MSPARLLAKSLTSCETRDEWVKEPSDFSSGVGIREIYRNKARDLTVSRWWAMYAGSGVSTPFELTKAEQKIVEEALDAFDRRKREEREAAALHRLTAQAGEAGTAETAKTGSARRASTRSRSDAPKGGRS